MKTFGIAVVGVFTLVGLLLLLLVWAGLAVGAANAWILESAFSDGWNAVWDRWLITFGWAFLFLGGVGGPLSVRR